MSAHKGAVVCAILLSVGVALGALIVGAAPDMAERAFFTLIGGIGVALFGFRSPQ